MTAPLFSDLGVSNPVLAAPMAGGPGTPALVTAAASAGSLGFLAGGYKTPEQLADDIAAARAGTDRFGVNLFAPNPLPVDEAEYQAYASRIQAEGDLYGLDLVAVPIREDDDYWQDKVDLLLGAHVPVVSFTFAPPDRTVIDAFRRSGSVVVQTVTSVDEARQAADGGVDVLAVQGAAAGAHYGTFTPRDMPPALDLPDLVAAVAAAVDLPVIAAGGLATPSDVTGVRAAGAAAVMVGTALLRSHESGASEPHKAALADGRRTQTVQTRAFTGRPARGLRNLFTERHDSAAPYGYPAVHHLTSPLRRAAAAAGEAETINLWAGTGFQHARTEPAASALDRLAGGGLQ